VGNIDENALNNISLIVNLAKVVYDKLYCIIIGNLNEAVGRELGRSISRFPIVPVGGEGLRSEDGG
jgi:hypothetical protein